jgi:citrate lyase beta subunit
MRDRIWCWLRAPPAGIGPPIDSFFPLLGDADGLRDQAQFARSLGFFGKSAIHPRQLEILQQVFTPTDGEIAWAHSVLAGFDEAGCGGLRFPAVSSSTCPSPTGLAGCSRSRGPAMTAGRSAQVTTA